MFIIGLGARQGGWGGPYLVNEEQGGPLAAQALFSSDVCTWNVIWLIYGLVVHLLGAVMAWSEGGPEPWWGGPYHAIQNWGWEVLWGSGGFPEKVCQNPHCILLGSDRAAVQRPVIRSTAPTSCLTKLATTLTHICLTLTSVSVFTCWPEFFELTKYASADSFLPDLDTGWERHLGVCYTPKVADWAMTCNMLAALWNELEGAWLTHSWALYCSHLTTYSCNGMGPGTLTYQEPLIPARCSDEASQAGMAQRGVLYIIILWSSPVGIIPLL